MKTKQKRKSSQSQQIFSVKVVILTIDTVFLNGCFMLVGYTTVALYFITY